MGIGQPRQMTPRDRSEVAELICVSLNYWYQSHGMGPIFPGGPKHADVFFEVYESLDPGCGLVVEDDQTGRLVGSCFFHPREHHVSLGIMNVHPNHFGRGVARALVAAIVDYTESHDYPALRLTQSALNLDSFSLYTRMGFVPRCAFQDMIVNVPDAGFEPGAPGAERVRPATAADIAAMAALEMDVAGITREKDYRFAVDRRGEEWDALVYEGDGGLDGLMLSVKYPGFCMLGPGIARQDEQAAALIAAALDRFRGGAAVFLVPVERGELVRQMYDWGARNCELHLCQVRGRYQPFRGISMPTFLPETG